jgi:hypothetical protein
MSVTIRQAAGRRLSDDRNPCSRRHEKLKCETDPVFRMRFFRIFSTEMLSIFPHRKIPPVKQKKKLVMTAFFPSNKSFL